MKRNHLIWIGPLVALAGAVSYFLVFARFAVLRDFPWVNLPLVVLGAVLSAVGAWRAFGRPEVFRGKVLGSLGLVLSLLLTVAFGAYVFWLSSLPQPGEVALALVDAPDFALESSSGETVRLSDFRGRKVVLVFYRGFW